MLLHDKSLSHLRERQHLESMRASDGTDVGALAGAHQAMRAELLHEAFFKALAALEGREGGRDWRALIAGLVTLRLADRRIASVEDDVPRMLRAVPDNNSFTPDMPADVIGAARAAVGAVDDHDPIAEPLEKLVQAVSTVTPGDLPRRLLAYAHALHSDSRWPLAADVYRTVLRFAASPRAGSTPDVQPFIPHTYDRLGRSLRMMGDLDEARVAYDAGRAAARVLGDSNAEWLIRISEAKILMHLGNLPAAAASLDAIIAEVTSHPAATTRPRKRRVLPDGGDPDHFNPVALAQHDRAVVASLQHDFNTAVENYFAAWHAYREPARRERVWADLAGSFSEMGLLDVARDALQLLYSTTPRRELRLLAATNLLELSVQQGDKGGFETYRQVLHDSDKGTSIPAEVAAKIALYEGRGEMIFGRPDAAEAAFERALALASLHRVYEVTIRADEALASLRSGRLGIGSLPTSTALPPSASVERIARIVHRARRRAVMPHP